MSVDAAVAELTGLAEHLAGAASGVRAGVRPVVAKGCLNIKKDVRQRWSGHSYAPALPRAVTYDTQETPTGARGEVGPEEDRPQGPLGIIFEFGTVRSRPIPALAPAARAEEPRFMAALEVLGEQAAR